MPQRSPWSVSKCKYFFFLIVGDPVVGYQELHLCTGREWKNQGHSFRKEMARRHLRVLERSASGCREWVGAPVFLHETRTNHVAFLLAPRARNQGEQRINTISVLVLQRGISARKSFL